METDYHIHYNLLRPPRDNSPSEKMSVILTEILTPAVSLKGYSELLGKRMSELNPGSPRLVNFQQTLLNIARQIVDARQAFFGTPHSQASLNQFTDKMSPIIDELTTLIEEVDYLEAELLEIYPEIPYLAERLQDSAHHIWATLDALTNPKLMLPDYISNWLDIQGELWEQIHNGDFGVIPTVKKALRNPLYDIRRDAISMLQHLKHPDSVAVIISVLGDENAEVRRDAIYALGQLGDERAV